MPASLGGSRTHFEGTFVVRTSADRAWQFFLDPKQLSVCIDDPHSIEIVDENHFRGTVKAGVGFIRGTFAVSATITDRTPPHTEILAHGSGMGSAFDIASSLDVSEADGMTTVRWAADVQLNGTIASVGARLLQGTVQKKTNAFFENARKFLEKT